MVPASHGSDGVEESRPSSTAVTIQTPVEDQTLVASPQTSRLSKVLSYDDPESISPLMLAKNKDLNDGFSLDRTIRKQRSVKLGKIGVRHESSPHLKPTVPVAKSQSSIDGETLTSEPPQKGSFSSYDVSDVVAQVRAWIQGEKEKRDKRRSKRETVASLLKGHRHLNHHLHHHAGSADGAVEDHSGRRGSDESDHSTALEKLEDLMGKITMTLSNERPISRKSSLRQHRSSIVKKLRRQSTVVSSDTELPEDLMVPSCDATLDNSKTLSYVGGITASDLATADSEKASGKDKEAWNIFKHEILRLAHTLKLKGWRQVPFDQSDELDVERLSGALTNAVYMVSPPREIRRKDSQPLDLTRTSTSKRPPPKLLLRIYGPQVEHLIDREAELQILRRLAAKSIGPRLLGTFGNGRFEEFFNARTLKPHDLRIPDTYKQIAKRMRELHDGIELLEEERDAGPFVWRNWDKWLDRVQQRVSYLDQQVMAHQRRPSDLGEKRKGGFVCGVEWQTFRKTVEKYRKWLEEQYGGVHNLGDHLVFAHNDTQYGNILRLVPPGESPLLLPANEHKQLVVIDFEYASANVPGLEFANHFTEWCYNYTDKKEPHACNTANYPTAEEQQRFLRSYVLHRPSYAPAASTSTTPRLGPTIPLAQQSSRQSVSSLSSFTLDSRIPPAQQQKDEEERDAAVNASVKGLIKETRLWRIANHAQWVAWGIVQAVIPGFEDDKDSASPHAALAPDQATDPLNEEEKDYASDLQGKRPEEEADNEEFDYLGYAQDRSFFFWGDCLQLGLISEADLPQELRERVKRVPY